MQTHSDPVLNRVLPDRPWRRPGAGRLPGIAPIAARDWLWQLDNYAGQMAERERLLAACPDRVHALLPEAEEAAGELLDTVLEHLEWRDGFMW